MSSSNPSYCVVIGLHLADWIGNKTAMQRKTALPFVPIAGMELGYLGRHADWSGEVQAVVWCEAENCFHVDLEDWMSHKLSLDEMLTEMGPEWQRLGPQAA